MKTRHAEDGWQPRPGSWEEAVEPYEVQTARTPSRPTVREPERRVEMAITPSPTTRTPVTM
jgi:hypothetical protein